MSLRTYIILMLIATIACFFGFVAIISFFDPSKGGILAILLFYLSLFLFLVGLFSLLGLFTRILFIRDQIVFKKVTISFRQAIWFSLLISICLYLKSLNLLNWRNALLLIFALLILELFFMSYKSKPNLKI